MSNRLNRKSLEFEALEARTVLSTNFPRLLATPDRLPPPPRPIPCIPAPVETDAGRVTMQGDRSDRPVCEPTDEMLVRSLHLLGDEVGRINSALGRLLETLGDPGQDLPDRIEAILGRINDTAEDIAGNVGDFLGDEAGAAEAAPTAGDHPDGPRGRQFGVAIRLQLLSMRLGGVNRRLDRVLEQIGDPNEATDAMKSELQRIADGAGAISAAVAPYLDTPEVPPTDPVGGDTSGDNTTGDPTIRPRPDGDDMPPIGAIRARRAVGHLTGIAAMTERASERLDGVLEDLGPPEGIIAILIGLLKQTSDTAGRISDLASGEDSPPPDQEQPRGERPEIPPDSQPIARQLMSINRHLVRAEHDLRRTLRHLPPPPEEGGDANTTGDDPATEIRERIDALLVRIATAADGIVEKVAPYLPAVQSDGG